MSTCGGSLVCYFGDQKRRKAIQVNTGAAQWAASEPRGGKEGLAQGEARSEGPELGQGKGASTHGSPQSVLEPS